MDQCHSGVIAHRNGRWRTRFHGYLIDFLAIAFSTGDAASMYLLQDKMTDLGTFFDPSGDITLPTLSRDQRH
jgi:hypothetical protein